MDFSIPKALPFSTEAFARFNEGLFLWIFHLEQTPPHIGVSLDGCYFHLKINHSRYQSVNDLLQKIVRKQLDVLVIELNTHLADKSTFSQLGKSYPQMSEKIYSCLFPILDLLGLKNEYLVLPDLLHRLQNFQHIQHYYRSKEPHRTCSIVSYTPEMVHAHFRELTIG